MIAPLILVFSSIAFGLLWVVFRYNVLYVTDSGFDSGGLLYPRALNQLFTGVYVMELCVTGLLCLVRDDRNEATCTIQAILMILATVMTVGFHILLNDAFAPLLQSLSISTGMVEPEEKRKANEHKCSIQKEDGYFQALLQKCRDWKAVPTTDRGSTTILFSNTKSEIDEFVSPKYQNSVLSVREPTIWIPEDCLGISNDEILRVRKSGNTVRISNKRAALDMKGKVTIANILDNESSL